jgi:hypothetical protein
MIPKLKSEGYSRDGIRLYPMDGGGSQQTGGGTQIQELPEWARPYAKSALEKGAALSEKPYQAYEAPRIAGFSPLQQQAQQQAAGMQTSGATGAGIGVAGEAAMRGLGTNYQGGQFEGGRFGGQQAAQYMSPFIQEALAPQLREAQRSSDILGQQNAARAVGQGAFGGSRSALVEAERQRNLGMQMGDIRAKGLQDAYTQAASQFNADQQRAMQAQQLGEQSRQFGANIGMQGLQTALTGAGQLGALGQQQFQQGMDINKLQSAYGGQQQALRQQGLTQAYEDFQNEQNYPYKQLGFMSDLIRGLPLGQQTTRTMYEPGPNAAQQLGAAGMGLYGLSKFMAEGGMAYADGGSVDSPDNVERIVSRLSDQQLQQAAQAAQARGDMDQLEAIQSEMAMRASERRGVAAGITPQMADRMAGGGVVAFSKPTEQNNYSLVSEDGEGSSDITDRIPYSAGNAALYGKFGKLGVQAFEDLEKLDPYEAMSEKDRRALTKKNYEELQQFAGADPYAPMADRIAKMDANRLVNLEKEKGAAAFEAIPAILQGRGIRGIGAGLGKLGSGLAAAAKADAAEQRALANQDFLLKDAQRKERMGLTKDAMGMTDKIEAAGVAAAKSRREALVAKGKLASDLAKAYRPIGVGAGGAGAPKPLKLAEQLAAAEIKHETNPSDATLKEVTALRRAMAQSKTTDVGATKADLTREGRISTENSKVQAAMKSFKYDPAYVEAKQAGKDEADRVWNEELARQRQFYATQNSAGNRNSGNNTPPLPSGYELNPSR